MDGESDSIPPPITIDTPWEDLEKILNPPSSNLPRLPDLTPLLSTERPSGLLSLCGPNSRTLPPLMTESIRQECRYYRAQAQTVQRRLEEQRRQRILELVEQKRQLERDDEPSSDEDHDECSTCSSSDDDTPVIVSRSASRLSPAPPSATIRANGTAFQSLIHRLRRNVQSPFVDQAMKSGPSPYTSTASVNTVVENPVFRARSGSYTVFEPSPVMKAYMAEHSDISDMSIMSRSSPNLLERSRELRQDLDNAETQDDSERVPSLSKEQRADQLNAYLGDLSRTPVLPKKCERQTSAVVPDQTEEQGEDDDKMSIASSVLHSMSIIAMDVPVDVSPRALGDLNPVVEPVIEPLEKVGPASESVERFASSQSEIPTKPSDVPIITIENDEEDDDGDEDGNEDEKEDEENNKENEPPKELVEVWSESPVPVPTIVSTPQGDRGKSAREIEDAVSSLAQAQQKQIQALMKAQEHQREELKRMFEEQQQRLVEEIMGTLSQSTVSNQSKSFKPKSTPLPFTPGASVQDRAPSPMIPALASQIRPTSTLPNGYKFPAKALDSEMHVKYCKLSALAKGFLVRRLLKTAKVQAIIESMKDTMNMALELHREARAGNRPVTAQDLDLHRRLLQQLNKDYHNLYDVFFNLSTSDKLGIISSDRAMRNSQKRRSKADQRRVSAVTQAKLERKRQLRELASQNGITQTKRGGSKSSSRSRSVEGPLRSKERRSSRRSLYNTITDSKKPTALTNQKNNRNIINNIGVSNNSGNKKKTKVVVPWK